MFVAKAANKTVATTMEAKGLSVQRDFLFPEAERREHPFSALVSVASLPFAEPF